MLPTRARTAALLVVFTLLAGHTPGAADEACGDNGVLVTVNTTATTCTGAPGATFNETTCTTRVTGSEQRCTCRHDYAGNTCDQQRQLACQLELVQPTFGACLSSNGQSKGASVLEAYVYDPEIGGHPPCWTVDGTSTADVVMRLRIDCKFKEPRPRKCNGTNAPSNYRDLACVEDTQFAYFYDNGRWDSGSHVVSVDPVARMRARFFDWNTLESVRDLTGADMSGVQLDGSIQSLVLTGGWDSMPDAAWTGGRAYLEVDVTTQVGTQFSMGFLKFDVDNDKYVEPMRTPVRGRALLITGVTLFVLVVLASSAVSWMYRAEIRQQLCAKEKTN